MSDEELKCEERLEHITCCSDGRQEELTLRFDVNYGWYSCLQCGAPWAPTMVSAEAMDRRWVLMGLKMRPCSMLAVANLLGLSRHTLRRKLMKYGLYGWFARPKGKSNKVDEKRCEPDNP